MTHEKKQDDFKHDPDCYMLIGGDYCDCESGHKLQVEAYYWDNYGLQVECIPNPELLAKRLERRKLLGGDCNPGLK
jgi:hypothetical protein